MQSPKDKQKKLLILDCKPDSDIIFSDIKVNCQKHGWEVAICTELKEAQHLLLNDEFEPHVILANATFSESQTHSFIEEVNQAHGHIEWIFISEDKVDAIQGFSDPIFEVISPPLESTQLNRLLQRALRSSLTAKRLHKYTHEEAKRYSLEAYLGSSKAIKELKDLLKSLSNVPISTMIISGETGTGKGLVARIIHHFGLRKQGPMVELNCAALPKDLLESQLFGHEAGAFTGAAKKHKGLFEQADGGTIFLDEISEMDIDLQAKLLKAIEDKRLRRLGGEREIQFDVQIIAATGSDLPTAVGEGKFREDLYHRLSVFCVNLPPLRDHKEDLLELVPRFIAEFNAKANKKVEFVSDQIWEALGRHDWPGNVRELRNVIERCVLLSTDESFPLRWLQLDNLVPNQNSADHIKKDASDLNSLPQSSTSEQLSIPIDGSLSLDEIERLILSEALKRHENNVTETARVLGTTRETLRYRVQKYKMDLT